MPRTITVLRVFVASPGDVAEERSLVKEVIDEINRMIESVHLHLEFVGWEEDVIPELGADPQAIINDQIADDYDIFIGILWTRFGTPTPRAPSGTKEEFDRAHKRFLDVPDNLKMLLYFSECPTNPAELDPEQVRLVQQFRKEVGEEGIYNTYKTVENFQSLVRVHLTRIALEWGKTWGTSGSEPPGRTPRPSGPAPEPPDDDSGQEDEGLFDLLEEGSEAMQESTEVVNRITGSLTLLTQSLTTRTAELTAASGSKDTRLLKRFVDRAADDLLTFADQVDSEIPSFARKYGTALEAFGRSAVLLPEIASSEVESIRESRDALRTIIESTVSAKDTLVSLRESVGSIPPMSTSLNRARARVVSTLDNLAAEWDRAISASRDVEGLYELALLEIDERSNESEA